MDSLIAKNKMLDVCITNYGEMINVHNRTIAKLEGLKAPDEIVEKYIMSKQMVISIIEDLKVIRDV